MAALTTPIVRSDMRLYPGMPVKRINVRAAGGKHRQAPSITITSTQELRPRTTPSRVRSDTEISSARSVCDVTFTSASTSPIPPAPSPTTRPSPLAVSQQYLSARRSHGHKAMTESQRRKRATSCMNSIAEEGPSNQRLASSVSAPVSSSLVSSEKELKRMGSIRRFFQRLRLKKEEKEEPLNVESTWRNPSKERIELEEDSIKS